MTVSSDLIGARFGRLSVVERIGSTTRGVKWRCRCDCGEEKHVVTELLTRIRSCGCLRKETTSRLSKLRIKHGDAAGGSNGTPEYRAWVNMIARCHSDKHQAFHNYGGRGIAVCDLWRNSYEAFLADVGRRPSARYSIDRIDNDGNYEPGNCRWATRSEQRRNQRPKS